MIKVWLYKIYEHTRRHFICTSDAVYLYSIYLYSYVLYKSIISYEITSLSKLWSVYKTVCAHNTATIIGTPFQMLFKVFFQIITSHLLLQWAPPMLLFTLICHTLQTPLTKYKTTKRATKHSLQHKIPENSCSILYSWAWCHTIRAPRYW